MARTWHALSHRIPTNWTASWLVMIGALAVPGSASAETASDAPPVPEEVAKPAKPSRGGPIFAQLGYSYDTRDFATFNITTFTGRLPYGFNIWGFTDISSSHDAGDERFDMVRHFMEYRFRWSPSGAAKNFGIETEYNDASGAENSVVRGGATWRFNVPILKKSWLQFRTLPVQSRGESSQFSIIHKLHLAKRVSLIGFSDLNVPWDGGPSRVVAESQLTYHLSPAIGIGVEARYNGFEAANADLDGMGIGFALMATL